MARIRISKNDKAIYEKLRRSAKSKLTRIKENYGIDLSNEINLPKLNEIETRKDFNNWVDKIESFTNRNNLNYQYIKNDYGLVISKKEHNELVRANARNIRKAKEQREKVRKMDYFKQEENRQKLEERFFVLGERDVTGISIPAKFNFKEIRTPRALKRVIENTKERQNPHYYNKKNEILKDNFIRSVEGTFNSDANDLVEKMRAINADDFYELYMMFNDDVMNFILYDSEGNEYVDNDSGKLEALSSVIDRFYKGEFNSDLKDFPNR